MARLWIRQERKPADGIAAGPAGGWLGRANKWVDGHLKEFVGVMPASAVASWDLKWGEIKAGWKQGYMGPQPFLCVPHMKKGCLIKRSRGSRQAGRPEGFVPLYVCEFLRKKDRFAAGCTTEQIYWKHRKCVLSINDGKRKERHVVRLTFIQRFTLLTIQVFFCKVDIRARCQALPPKIFSTRLLIEFRDTFTQVYEEKLKTSLCVVFKAVQVRPKMNPDR